MAQLHEVLAVEGGLEETSKKTVKEAIDTFTKKAEHFSEHIKSLEMFDDARKNEEQAGAEYRQMTTTVGQKLAYVANHVTRHLDAMADKDVTNLDARANLIIDGETILAAAPATLLLGLENRLKALRPMYLAIPTLTPGRDWVPDTDKGVGVWRDANPSTRMRTEKQVQSRIVAPATVEHPAKVETWGGYTMIGKFTDQEWSGALSPAQKSAMLGRLDKLIREVKKARQKANMAKVQNVKIGEAIFGYLHTDD